MFSLKKLLKSDLIHKTKKMSETGQSVSVDLRTLRQPLVACSLQSVKLSYSGAKARGPPPPPPPPQTPPPLSTATPGKGFTSSALVLVL